jgi:hypothetical protein
MYQERIVQEMYKKKILPEILIFPCVLKNKLANLQQNELGVGILYDAVLDIVHCLSNIRYT